MVETQLRARGITDKSVLTAMNKVPREAYVPQSHSRLAYADSPLPIDAGQTISQPYMVAAMTTAIQPKPEHVVLEIGTGSGYQAAVLAELVENVYTIEIVDSLARAAQAVLSKQGYTNVFVQAGDGYKGWPEHAPFDGIIVTAAPDHVPDPLIDQLKPGGRMVIPVGPLNGHQELLLIQKDEEGAVSRKGLMTVRFVPFTGGNVEQKQRTPGS